MEMGSLAISVSHNSLKCVSVDRTPDEFCRLAGVAEGTVKGCMIVKQEVSLEALLGGPQVAAMVSAWGLWYSPHHSNDCFCHAVVSASLTLIYAAYS